MSFKSGLFDSLYFFGFDISILGSNENTKTIFELITQFKVNILRAKFFENHENWLFSKKDKAKLAQKCTYNLRPFFLE